MAKKLTKGIAFPVSTDLYGGIEMANHVRSIEDSIRIILGTAPGEFFLYPDFGCRINDMIFMPDNPSTITLAEYHITQALNQWEPRIKLKQVKGVIDKDERNTLNISITYDIPALGKSGEVSHDIDMS